MSTLGLGLGPNFLRQLMHAGGGFDALSRWRSTGGKLYILGDSTADPTTYAVSLYSALATEQAAGGYLQGTTIVADGQVGVKAGSLNLTAVSASNAKLIFYCMGINNVRIASDGETEASLRAKIITEVDAIRAAVPGADIMLVTPNSLLQPTSTPNFNVEPPSNAQPATDILYNVYNGLRNHWSHTQSLDKQTAIFGRTVQVADFTTLMSDHLHPAGDGQNRTAGLIVGPLDNPLIGAQLPFAPPIDEVASAAAWASDPVRPYNIYARALEDTRYAVPVRRGQVAWNDAGADVGIKSRIIDSEGTTYLPEWVATGDWFWSPIGTIYIDLGNFINQAGSAINLTTLQSSDISTVPMSGLTVQYRPV